VHCALWATGREGYDGLCCVCGGECLCVKLCKTGCVHREQRRQMLPIGLARSGSQEYLPPGWRGEGGGAKIFRKIYRWRSCCSFQTDLTS
jgi:hypothetical protein